MSHTAADSAKLDVQLGRMTLSSDQDDSTKVHTEDLNGVVLKRIPMTDINFETGTTMPSFQYLVQNTRSYAVRLLMVFTGTNMEVKPGSSAFTKKSATEMEGKFEAKSREQLFLIVDAADKAKNFSFNAEVHAFPVAPETRVKDLEGVILTTTFSYDNDVAELKFEAHNTKEYDVEVELTATGRLHSTSGPMPFLTRVDSGARRTVGWVKSSDEVESNWKWRQLEKKVTAPTGTKQIQTSETNGVFLKQTLTSGNPNTLEFEVDNTRDRDITVEIDVDGDDVDFKGQSRPLKSLVPKKNKQFIAAISIRKDVNINWKFKEED